MGGITEYRWVSRSIAFQELFCVFVQFVSFRGFRILLVLAILRNCKNYMGVIYSRYHVEIESILGKQTVTKTVENLNFISTDI